MKFLSGHLAYALRDDQLRQNVGALVRYAAFLAAVVVIHSTLFHVIMWRVEGQEHSWITGFYWTLTVMSTLGFGDITFSSDVGRMFSMVVLLSGIILLLIVLPFAFIRYFYGPWLETRLRLRAPREVPPGTEGHVIICAWDGIAPDLVSRLERSGMDCYVLEPDPERAARMHGEGIPVIRGDVDDVETYRRCRVADARMVLVNLDDRLNTNIVLTVRELSETTRVMALAADLHSVDILELGGASDVFLLKTRLGEQLANRVNAGHAQAHVVGRFEDLVIAEFSAHGTPLAGRTIRDSALRDIAGVNIVGVWEKGRISAPRPDVVLAEMSLAVVAGSEASIERLNEYLFIYDTNWHAVVVLGGGKVGRAASRDLKRRGIPVHLVEQEPTIAAKSGDLPDRLVVGNAADREVMREAGVDEAPSILLTTNDDATNIYLAAYCRRLNPDARIISRITHNRNLASIHRAGADFTLSYATLGVETIYGALRGRPPVILGEGIQLLDVSLPPALAGSTLGESRIGETTGLTVIAIKEDGRMIGDPGPATTLSPESTLLAIGTAEQARLLQEMRGK